MVCDKTNGRRGHAPAHCRASNPVAQIGKAIRRTDLIDAAATEEATAFAEDRKLVRHSLFGKLLLKGHPPSSFVERVVLVAPGHPGVDLGHRLKGGGMHLICVPLLVETDGDFTHSAPLVLCLNLRRTYTLYCRRKSQAGFEMVGLSCQCSVLVRSELAS